MKYVMLCLLLSFSGTGCKVLMDTNTEQPPIQAPPLKVTQRSTPVQPDEITAANAHSKARQLLDELENDNGEDK